MQIILVRWYKCTRKFIFFCVFWATDSFC